MQPSRGPQPEGDILRVALLKRTVAGALAGIIGSAVAVGALLAQAPVPGAAGQAHGLEAIYGLWSPAVDCRVDDTLIAIWPRIFITSGAMVHSHAQVTLAAAPDGVLMTPVRNVWSRGGRWMPRDLGADGRGWVFQRRGDTLAIVRVIDRDGREQAPPDPARGEVLHACR